MVSDSARKNVIDWNRVKQVFSLALEAPVNDRNSLIEHECGDDDVLKESVGRLLESHMSADQFLVEDDDCEPHNANSRCVSSDPDQIGPYKILAIIGEGGFGRVYRASQTSPIQREVAVKLLKPGMDSARVVRRFLAERDLLSKMSHPGIAKILDAGATPEGRPFVVMELVRGDNIVKHSAALHLSVREHVALVMEVSRAIHHAHQRAILHRDIKPSNILVAELDGVFHPIIIDFGIARVLSADSTTHQTMTGDLVGTPRYMSPEQLIPGSHPPDIRTDVYSLGVLLCELLTGEVPREQTNLLTQRTPAERPSQLVLRQPLGIHQSDGLALNRRLRGDLDRIVLKCVEWDVEDRYDSAAALANDLERYLAGEPITAIEPSSLYRLRKFVVRNKALSALVIVAVFSLVIGTAVASIGLQQAIRERDSAHAAEQESDHQATRAQVITQFFLEDLLTAADPDVSRGESIAVSDLLDDATSRADERFADDNELRFDVLSRIGKAFSALGRGNDAARVLTRALELGRSIHGPDHPSVLDVELAHLHSGFFAPGHQSGSKLPLAQFRDRVVKLLGNEHPLALRARVLASHLVDNIDRNISELEDIIASLERIGHDREPVYFEALSQLSLNLAKAGRFAEAEVLCRQTREIAVLIYGPLHTANMRAMDYHVQMLMNLNRFTDAERLATDLVDAGRRLYRRDDLRFRTHLFTLVKARLVIDDGEGAIPPAKERYELTEEYDGKGSVAHSTAGNTLGRALIAAGRYEEAVSILNDALIARREAWGDDSTQVGGTLGELASAYLGLRRYEHCIDYAEQALVRLKPHRIHATRFLIIKARAMYALGQHTEAVNLLANQLRDPIAEKTSPGSAELIKIALSELSPD